MKLRRPFATLGLVIALAIPVAAIAAPLVALDSAVFVEKIQPGRGRTLLPASQLRHGDRVVYLVNWFRTGGAGAFTVSYPIPRTVYFEGSADGSEEVSLDGGRTWGKLDAMRVGGRLATPEDVTNVRWHISSNAAAKGSGEIAYSAIVR